MTNLFNYFNCNFIFTYLKTLQQTLCHLNCKNWKHATVILYFAYFIYKHDKMLLSHNLKRLHSVLYIYYPMRMPNPEWTWRSAFYVSNVHLPSPDYKAAEQFLQSKLVWIFLMHPFLICSLQVVHFHFFFSESHSHTKKNVHQSSHFSNRLVFLI